MAQFIPFVGEQLARDFIALCDRGYGYPKPGTQTYAEPLESAGRPGQFLVKCDRSFAVFVANLGRTSLTAQEQAQVVALYATRVTVARVRGIGADEQT